MSYSSAPEYDLSGTIPAELGNLTSLTRLWLENNKLSGEEGILVIVYEFCAVKKYLTDRICRSMQSYIELFIPYGMH